MRDAAHNRLSVHLEDQARACANLGSPFTARICRALAQILDTTTSTGQRALDWPGDMAADALALRLCGGLHALVLSGVDAELSNAYPPAAAEGAGLAGALRAAIARHDARLAAGLDSAPQTNEIARAAMLLPGLLTVARETGLPLAVCEIGASAGLNLLVDRFHYRFGETDWGDPSSPVELAPELRGRSVPVSAPLLIAERSGCDIAPLDISRQDHRLRLRSYVWADQPARLQRLDAAIALALAEPPAVRKADAADFIGERIAARRAGETFVLMHSIMWQYMPASTQDAIAGLVYEAGSKAGAAAPIAWLRMEPVAPREPSAALLLTLWPGGETRRLANCDYHGRWIEWLAPIPARRA